MKKPDSHIIARQIKELPLPLSPEDFELEKKVAVAFGAYIERVDESLRRRHAREYQAALQLREQALQENDGKALPRTEADIALDLSGGCISFMTAPYSIFNTVCAAFSGVADCLAEGEEVELEELGRFSFADTPDGKKTVVFSPCQDLLERLNRFCREHGSPS